MNKVSFISFLKSPKHFYILASSTKPTSPFHSSLVDLSTEKKHLNFGFNFSYYFSYFYNKMSASLLFANKSVKFGVFYF
jgi:hypothetical protein